MQQQAAVMEQAVALETAGDTHEALRLYREMSESPHTDSAQRVNALFRLGLLHEVHGAIDQAILAWTTGAETPGDAEISRRCAFHAACALAAAGESVAAAGWLRCALAVLAEGEPSQRAVQWKLVAVEPESADLPAQAEGWLEALLAVEAGFALEQAGDVAGAVRAYELALAAEALQDESRENARMRLAVVRERLALRSGAMTTPASLDALHVETWSALQRNDLEVAARLAAQMPDAAPETAARIGHMLITTAFRLEKEGDTAVACDLYRRAANDEGLGAADRTNASFRLGLLIASADREQAIECLWRAVDSPDDGVHAAATLHLVHHLLMDESWRDALALCESKRIHDQSLAQLLAVRSLQCRAWLDRWPVYPESAAEALPSPLAAHAGAWIEAALACESTDHYRVARVLYERLLGLTELAEDIRANVQFRLGLALDRMMLWTDAEPWLRQAANSPAAWAATRVHARYRLAGIYYLLDQYDRALPEYDKLRTDAEADPAVRADAQLKHGMCLHRLERVEEAARDFRTCRAIGGEIEVKAELMLAEIAETQRDYAAARESYNRVMQHAQASPLTKTAAYQRLKDLPRR